MSSFSVHYNPQLDWWNQPVDTISALPSDPDYTLTNANASGYSLQQNQDGDCQFYSPTQNPDAYQNTRAMPKCWVGETPSYPEPPMSFSMFHLGSVSESYSSSCVPLASFPPAAFTKQPLVVDHFSSNHLPTIDNTTPSPFYGSTNQVLPASEVPALEYDSTSADDGAYGRRNWTDSPMPDEIDSLPGSAEADDNMENADPCYAELLRQALMEKKDDHTMLLKDLYEWVRTHSSKAQDPSNRGWQNSVRHNLSMNAAFERVPPANQEAGTKKTSYWRLTQHAVEHGISSTTRYRKDSKRKTQRNPNPALIRVQAGAKGGQATRRSVRRQQMAASPPDGLSPYSGRARQRNLHRPQHLRQFATSHLEVPSMQQIHQHQQSFPTSRSPPHYGNAANMFNPVPSCYPTDAEIDDTREFSAPYGTAQILDWSTSPSPIGHVSNDINGWSMGHNALSI